MQKSVICMINFWNFDLKSVICKIKFLMFCSKSSLSWRVFECFAFLDVDSSRKQQRFAKFTSQWLAIPFLLLFCLIGPLYSKKQCLIVGRISWTILYYLIWITMDSCSFCMLKKTNASNACSLNPSPVLGISSITSYFTWLFKRCFKIRHTVFNYGNSKGPYASWEAWCCEITWRRCLTVSTRNCREVRSHHRNS